MQDEPDIWHSIWKLVWCKAISGPNTHTKCPPFIKVFWKNKRGTVQSRLFRNYMLTKPRTIEMLFFWPNINFAKIIVKMMATTDISM